MHIKKLVIAGALVLTMGLPGTAIAAHREGHTQGGGNTATTLGALDCAAGEIAKFDGTAWTCQADTTLDQGGIEAFGFTTGTHTINTDTLDDLVCADGGFLRLDPAGSGEWQCMNANQLKFVLGLAAPVFVTSAGYTGNLQQEATTLGLPGAPFGITERDLAGDAICNFHAESAGLPGTYIAWLSAIPGAAVDLLTPGSGPFFTTGGIVIADDIADLTDGNLTAPINSDENGVEKEVLVWTGTLADGLSSGESCTQWSSTSNTGTVGYNLETTGGWTNSTSLSCDGTPVTASLYCFPQ